MAYNVHILGLNTATISIGLALGQSQGEILRTGFDPERQIAKDALELGAIDSTISKPWKNIASANLVILGLAEKWMDNIYDGIGEDISEDCIVLDVSQVKRFSHATLQKHFNGDERYIGVTPIVGIRALIEPESYTGSDTNPYEGGLFAIVTSPHSSENAIALATNIGGILGATPFYIDMEEHDFALSAVADLPDVLQLMLINSTANSPSWRELQRMAGTKFARSTAVLEEMSTDELSRHMFANKDKLLDRLSSLTMEIDSLSQALGSDEDTQLEKYIELARTSREQWLQARHKGEFEAAIELPSDMPGRGDFFANLFGFRSPKRQDTE